MHSNCFLSQSITFSRKILQMGFEYVMLPNAEIPSLGRLFRISLNFYILEMENQLSLFRYEIPDGKT